MRLEQPFKARARARKARAGIQAGFEAGFKARKKRDTEGLPGKLAELRGLALGLQGKGGAMITLGIGFSCKSGPPLRGIGAKTVLQVGNPRDVAGPIPF